MKNVNFNNFNNFNSCIVVSKKSCGRTSLFFHTLVKLDFLFETTVNQ